VSRPGAVKRWMYRGDRPHHLAALLNRWWAIVGSAGVGPDRLVTLEVRGRGSGRLLSFPVMVADHHGERYLVAMLGEGANWVSNVRAAGGQAALRQGHREAVRLEEVDPSARAPILRRYLQIAPGARPHIPVDRRAPLAEFQGIASQYPVFRVGPARAARRTDDHPIRVKIAT
jgi:F420H(2)-dependent quinone reductase